MGLKWFIFKKKKKKSLVPEPFLISKFSFITTGDQRKKPFLRCPAGLLLNHLHGCEMTLMVLLSGVTGHLESNKPPFLFCSKHFVSESFDILLLVEFQSSGLLQLLVSMMLCAGLWASDSQHAAVRPVVGSAKVLIPNHLWERKGGRRDGGGGERRVGARSLSPSFSLSLDFSLIFSLSRRTKHSADIYMCGSDTGQII